MTPGLLVYLNSQLVAITLETIVDSSYLQPVRIMILKTTQTFDTKQNQNQAAALVVLVTKVLSTNRGNPFAQARRAFATPVPVTCGATSDANDDEYAGTMPDAPTVSVTVAGSPVTTPALPVGIAAKSVVELEAKSP